LGDLIVELSHAYGISSQVSKRSEKAQAALDDLRSALDDVVGKDCPDKTARELNELYYPGNKLRKSKSV
jgi:5-bromo-4-chloroindolyl phosphate hydrolysis protein